ncbi:transcriptional regulator, MerR family protein [Roseibium aggregatum IAM 12614]|uniref:Transcriptional regulator, MerR family protein n=1 Tax=Roseibium aggregatum (strain ATCC 25650 / DSM 13394 / JCM 20685 / NBRC 16684 / NCIMB 2208 / IAM 12614 / B1) TaxID=384765 RepID=A0NSD1_ROSAI|nr:MerR family transcriptional regulator [Roseibium aggregatum]EAV44460.1 transcriptional regulator, MerR family protein [Roseibium aggregatum IAM 12614]
MKGVDMQIKEAAERLGITERMLRHYEKSGLMETRRSENGYRIYSAADLRRAGRIRDFIATGFSTREVRAMAACLSDEGSGPCEGGIPQLLKKLEHIDRLSAELEAKREAILDRLAVLEDVFPVGAEEKDHAQALGDTPFSGQGASASGGHHTELEPHASGR